MTLNYQKRRGDGDGLGTRGKWGSPTQRRLWSYNPRAWGSEVLKVKPMGLQEEEQRGFQLWSHCWRDDESTGLRGRAEGVSRGWGPRGPGSPAVPLILRDLALQGHWGGTFLGRSCPTSRQRTDPGGQRPCSCLNSED